jgi:methyltransferase (TIGR00027 family)
MDIQTESKLVNHISDTAFWAAASRAIESERRDALFLDPLSKDLAGEKGYKIATHMPGWEQTLWAVVIRTHSMDQLLLKAIKNNAIDCIVNMAAGLDTRPYRLPLSKNMHWIEVDFPHLIEFKETKLKNNKPVCHLERMSCDLSNPADRNHLLKTIHQKYSKILIITEGFIEYLSEDQVASLVDDINQYSHFQFWIQDYCSSDVAKGMTIVWSKQMPEDVALKFAPPNWVQFFADRDWKTVENRTTTEEAFRFKRETREMRIKRFFHLISLKSEKKGNKHLTGYLLLCKQS